MFDLSGKRALVTGASGGIGAAIAETLHRQGATVALSGTRRDALDALGRRMAARVHVVPGDLADPAAPAAMVAAAEQAMGGLDILVNNAGVTRDTLVLRMKDEDWATVIRIDLDAVFRLSRAALRGMLKSRWGRIVNITSVVGHTGNPGQVNYAAAKAGVVGLSKSLAQEVASRGITVNCVAPGFIQTAMTDGLTEEQKKRILDTVPLARLGTPADVAACVGFLASDEAGYVTGQTLHVNGGMAMI
jgi:3-oxoacyl-[acyl-carrier protein] reductase